MGFTPRSTVYTLDFEGTDYEGLEVRMRASTLGALFAAPELLGIKQRAASSEEFTIEAAQRSLAEITDMADHLVSWNVEDEAGVPVPANLEGLKTLEMPLVLRIGRAWQSAMGDVAAPLPSGSGNGALPDLSMIPMASVPESLAS